MRTADYDFGFPENLIAYHPLPRGESRMMVMERSGPSQAEANRRPDSGPVFSHTRDLVEFLNPGDVLVLNDTKVLRARLIGQSASGGRIEALLLAPSGTLGPQGLAAVGSRWEAMVKPGRRFRAGDRIAFSPRLTATVAEVREDGTRMLDFDLAPDEFLRELEVTGRIPLPPYIRREADEGDAGSYQSVFAENFGSVAAPTASLHLSEAMLEAIRAKGVEIRKVTLHIGAGTFKPVQAESLEGHAMHSESYSLPAETAEALNAVKRRGGKVWAVGTTVARVLETRALGLGSDVFIPGAGETRIFIYPGYAWKGVDGLLTNFHWPRSTLFMLVCSLLGTDRAKRAYEEAFSEGFRLFSYGDAMLIR
ncbi:MAG: tRNA preQ1(34) S-adenosylmethionine ribosyltransferase-isomerase QueA [Fibrobacterota bacterium]|nr:tRNA preQ1(34) S-adenosylmethionine ribosyltransferase-isomerase QueA [Fibrobacterota bacterium]